jgi:hypothetical protein
VLRKRSYLTLDLCRAVLQSPLNKVIQPDGRIRVFGRVTDASGQARILRVVMLADGHNQQRIL